MESLVYTVLKTANNKHFEQVKCQLLSIEFSSLFLHFLALEIFVPKTWLLCFIIENTLTKVTLLKSLYDLVFVSVHLLKIDRVKRDLQRFKVDTFFISFTR